MAERLTCRLCETRKPKRACPGIGADICPQCCGREREESIHCPLDCVYLAESRKHDGSPIVDPHTFPHQDIRVEEEFIEGNPELFTVLSIAVINAAQDIPGVLDNDLRECLEAVIKTYLTLDAGIIYESRPANMVAAAVQARVMAAIEEFKEFAFEKTGLHSVKDGDLLKMFVFLQRLELTTNNGRRYGRAFLSALRQAFELPPSEGTLVAPETDASSSLII